MNTFIKSQTASLISTATDFAIFIVWIEIFNCLIVPSGIVGNVAGAVVNFILGRHWVFDRGNKKLPAQALKYTAVWCGYLVLSTSGMIFMEHFTSFHYLISKITVSIIISFTYTYYSQKKLVFN